MPQDIEQREINGVVLVALTNKLEKRMVATLSQSLEALMTEGYRDLAIDLAQVERVSSEGVRVLFGVAQRLHRLGGHLVLCALGPRLAEVFEIAGFDRQFSIVADREAALDRLQGIRGASLGARVHAALLIAGAPALPLPRADDPTPRPGLAALAARAGATLESLPEFQLPPQLDVAAGVDTHGGRTALESPVLTSWARAKRFVNDLIGT